MANPKHEAILRQGVGVWNKWRKDNRSVKPDFNNSIFVKEDLSGADLSGANFSSANLSGTKLNKSNLSRAVLNSTNLSSANLNDANLKRAFLSIANLTRASLRNVNFSGAQLDYTDFSSADLSGADFEACICGSTIFANLDLSTTMGLDKIVHRSSSILSVNTLFKSKGKIPEIFLRGCGVSETLITFLPSMMEDAIVFYSCFISYSHADKEFAKRLYDRLQGEGIRCWLDEHQLNPGDELHSSIYDAIRVYDKVILCCSETALKSWWVEKEFKNVIGKEEDYAEKLLIPLTLDNYVLEQTADRWIIGEIKRRAIQKFDNWKDHDAFEQSFEKIVKALRTDGGKPPPPESKLTKRT